jgi:hypothetical protein
MMADLFRACRRNLVRLSRDRRGVTAVVVALTLAALIGFTGLGVETGLWYAIQRYNQSAADVAALSGAMEKAGGQGYSDICGLAQYAANANGFTVSGTCPTNSPNTQSSCTSLTSGQMCVNNPPLFGGGGTPAANYVEVILAQQQSTFFSLLSLASANVTINTRAVAGFPNVTSCMLALSPSGTDLQDNGGGNATNLNIPNCSIISNSTSTRKPINSILLHGNVKINAGAIDTAGNYRITGNSNSISPPIVTGIPPVTDPYGSVTSTAVGASGCTADPNVNSGSTTLVPGTDYCSLTISGGTVTVPAGVYYLVGGPVTCNKNGKNCSGPPGNLTISGGTITQTGTGGVTFVLTAQTNVSAAGSVQITGGSGSLTAPSQTGYLTTAAASTGLLIYQDPTTSANSAANTIAPGGACNASLALTGAIYTPNTQDGLSGNQTAACSTCTELIAASFLFNGDTSLDTSQCTNFGVKTASVPGKVALSQ